MPNETITIFNGQCGVQMGSAIWELICAEHGIRPDGQMTIDESRQRDRKTFCNDVLKSGENFFYESNYGLRVPRCLFNDLEHTCIDEIRSGAYRNLFHPECLISNKEDAANVFARGYWSIGSTQIQNFNETLRNQMELTESCSALIFCHSCGGGTGSGYNALQVDTIYELYPKTSKIECTMYPSGTFSTNMVEPYNSLLATHYTMNPIDLAFLWDNDSLYRIASRFCLIKRPNYNNCNRLTSQIFSSITACTRFGGSLSGQLIDYQTNLVPYPRIHFPICAYAPIMEENKAAHESFTVVTLTKSIFRNDSQFCSVDVENGQFVSAVLLYRGDVCLNEVFQCVAKLKCDPKIHFVDWCPTGVKFTLCSMPPVNIPQSGMAKTDKNVLLMSNNSSVCGAFETLVRKFNHLYTKRAFVHWYVGEGMEEGEFIDALENIRTLCNDYKDCYPEFTGTKPEDAANADSGQKKPSPKGGATEATSTVDPSSAPEERAGTTEPTSEADNAASPTEAETGTAEQSEVE